LVEIGQTERTATAKDTEYVADSIGRFVNDAIETNDQLPQYPGVSKVFFKDTYGGELAREREVLKRIHGIVDLQEPSGRCGTVKLGANEVVDFAQLFQCGRIPDDVYTPCLSRYWHIPVQWLMPLLFAITAQDLRTVRGIRKKSMSGSKSPSQIRTVAERPFCVTKSGWWGSRSREMQPARLFRYVENDMMPSACYRRRISEVSDGMMILPRLAMAEVGQNCGQFVTGDLKGSAR